MAVTFDQIKKVACSGAGVIGSSFAASFALAGYPTNVYEINDACKENAQKAVNAVFDSMIELGFAPAEKVEAARALVNYTTDSAEAFGDVQFIQENGPEKIEIKRSIVENLDKHAPAGCIICSSTTGLKISDIAANSAHPERYLGAHPWNPPHLIPLVEMAQWQGVTDPQALETALAFYKSMGKEPIVMKKEMPGFVANRLAHAIWREEIAMVMDGVCTLEDADKAMCFGPGLRYAIFGAGMIYQLSGGAGLRGASSKFSATTNNIFQSLYDLQEVPEVWPQVSGDQVDVEMANMPDFKGHTNEELAAFRDKCLVQLLKMHGKI